MTLPHAMPAPKPFPVPENFPIEWPSPELARLTFNQDRMHVPFPMSPMGGWWSKRFARGFNGGFQAYSAPMRCDVLRLNTYFYLGVNPSVAPEMMPELEAKAEPLLKAAAGRAWERWENEWLPELKKGWSDWNSRDLESLSDADLAAAAHSFSDWYVRIWTIHFELLPPVMVSASVFQDLYTSIFPDRPGLAAFKLLQGQDNHSLEAGRELWLIAQEAARNPVLKELIEKTPASELWAALSESGNGRELRQKLSQYLNVYGRRSDNVQDVSTPSWIEDPTPALVNLKKYINDSNDPRELLARQAADRDAAVAEARAAIAAHPEELRGAFEGLLRIAQDFGRLQENHNFWIDQRGTHEARQLCLEIGKRLAGRGIIADAKDIFMLDVDEGLEALQGKRDGLRELVAARRAEMEHWAKIQPPPQVGTDYGPPPPNPIATAMGRFFGGPPPALPTAAEIRGNTGSPGKVTGTARIVMNISEGWRLEPDEILVAPTTAPPWTPLFATAAAVVTETGGVLSHCAIVAREYGIPAVVGAAGATALIKDGATIEVDGDAGTVRLL
ncbi:MAG: PEP-utilizing enzyme [Dehalococcoidia bacterium]